MSFTMWEVPSCDKHKGVWHSDCEDCKNLTQEEIDAWYASQEVIMVPKPKRVKKP